MEKKEEDLTIIPPIGWIGIGLNVLGKYDNGSNEWLNYNGGDKEWAIAYHGTSGKFLKSILINGFMIGSSQFYQNSRDIYHPDQKVGVGVYVTPDSKTMEQFTKNNVVNINGKKYLIALMLRVKPDKIRCPSGNQNFWIVNASADEIRPYRILLKEI